jgi:hypothetical protein
VLGVDVEIVLGVVGIGVDVIVLLDVSVSEEELPKQLAFCWLGHTHPPFKITTKWHAYELSVGN